MPVLPSGLPPPVLLRSEHLSKESPGSQALPFCYYCPISTHAFLSIPTGQSWVSREFLRYIPFLFYKALMEFQDGLNRVR